MICSQYLGLYCALALCIPFVCSVDVHSLSGCDLSDVRTLLFHQMFAKDFSNPPFSLQSVCGLGVSRDANQVRAGFDFFLLRNECFRFSSLMVS